MTRADPLGSSDTDSAQSSATEPTTAEPSTTAAAHAPSTTRTSTTDDASELRRAIRFIWSFDPVGGDPDELAEALDITGVLTGLEVPRLIEQGTAAAREVVFRKLAEPSSWSIPILVGMKEYGMPSGSIDSPQPWPETTLAAIDGALTMSADASYGACAQLMIDLNWQNITEEVDGCAAEGCDWGGVWYSVGEAVTGPIGVFVDDTRFEGTVASDTGAGDASSVTVELLDRWAITERAAQPELSDSSAPNDCRPPPG